MVVHREFLPIPAGTRWQPAFRDGDSNPQILSPALSFDEWETAAAVCDIACEQWFQGRISAAGMR